jgi:hypothetical protein
MGRTYSKEDVEFHSDGFEPGKPAVNVKVDLYLRRVPLPLDLGSYSDDGGKTFTAVRTDPAFDHDWIEEHITDEQGDSFFQFACEDGWEQLQSAAEEVWGTGVKVYSEGRSGGWAIVDNLPPFDSWDARELGRWRRFERLSRGIADDIPRTIVDMIYANVWQPAREELLGNLT